MKYATFSEQGMLSGRYDSVIHGKNIPAGAIEVSEELFLQTISEADGVWMMVDGAISKQPFPEPPPLTDDEIKAEVILKRDALAAEASEATAGMADAYIVGLLEDEEVELFKEFASYKLALSKIEKQPGYPVSVIWPPKPVR